MYKRQHVEQAGSYQDAERTRFDFSHFSAMTAEELKRVEDIDVYKRQPCRLNG